MAGQNSGEKLAGIEGQVGEEQAEAEGYLSVVLVGTGSGRRCWNLPVGSLTLTPDGG